MRTKVQDVQDEMRAEYEFDYSKAVRGKYYQRLLKEGANLVVLEPDVAKAFGSSAEVNEVLRSLIKVARAAARETATPAPTVRKRRIAAAK
jgi:hypothetical protein